MTVNLGLRYEEQRLKWGEQLQDVLNPLTV